MEELESLLGGGHDPVRQGFQVSSYVCQGGSELMSHIDHHRFPKLLDVAEALRHPVEG